MAATSHDATGDHAGRGRVTVSRCSSEDRGASILQQDYSDAPVRFFPRGVLRTLARAWRVPLPDVAFLVAEVDGDYAGFVLAQARGRRFWSSIVREYPRHLPAFITAWVRTRVGAGAGVNRRSGTPVTVPAVARPFAWSDGHGVAAVEFVYVRPECRGAGVARALLAEAERAMRVAGARLFEAHIDADNYSSVKAFLGSGWEVSQMSGGDFRAHKLLLPPDETPAERSGTC